MQLHSYGTIRVCAALALLTIMTGTAVVMLSANSGGASMLHSSGKCSASQVFKQVQGYKGMTKAHGALWSGCGGEMMMQRLYEADPTRDGKTFVNAGANKGFASAMWLTLWAGGTVNIAQWHKLLEKKNQQIFKKTDVGMCGACKECRDVFVGNPDVKSKAGSKIYIHSIEPSPINMDMLKEMQKSVVPMLGDKAVITLHNQAATNVSGTAKFPSQCNLGQEDCSLAGVPSSYSIPKKYMKFVDIPTTTIDKFLETNKLAHVDHLKIDAEGWDPLILEGAKQSFKSNNVRLVEFEYHGVNYWANKKDCKFGTCFELEDIVRELDGYGYDCFIEGSPTMVRLTKCWHPSFETHSHGNVACVLRSDKVWLGVLNGLSSWL